MVIISCAWCNFIYFVPREKDGKLVTDIESIKSRLRLKDSKGIYTLSLLGAQEADGGNYSCAVRVSEEETKRAYIIAASK